MSANPTLPATPASTRVVPGKSGNPRGRPAGSRNSASLAVENLMAGEAEALTRKVIDRALEGDPICLRLCLERIAPRRKDRVVTFELPPIANAEDAELAGGAVLAAVAAGQLTPREGNFIMAALIAQTTLIEAGSHERRLVELEATVRR